MNKISPKDAFLESLERCSDNEAFIPAFYERFLSSSEEVRDKFIHTDFDQQNRMILQSLRLAAGATAGEPASLRDLRERAETHSRHRMNIKPKMYDWWLESLIETAREFDPVWSEGIESAWRVILGHVIRHMVKWY